MFRTPRTVSSNPESIGSTSRRGRRLGVGGRRTCCCVHDLAFDVEAGLPELFLRLLRLCRRAGDDSEGSRWFKDWQDVFLQGSFDVVNGDSVYGLQLSPAVIWGYALQRLIE